MCNLDYGMCYKYKLCGDYQWISKKKFQGWSGTSLGQLSSPTLIYFGDGCVESASKNVVVNDQF